MYYSGKLVIDPSQVTVIESMKPSSFGGFLMYCLNGGDSPEKQETETFTAVSILQQFHSVFRSLGFHNIIKLTLDGSDHYMDEKGEEHDLKEAIESFQLGCNPKKATGFNKLELVLEHDEGCFKYLVSISICRIHKIGEYPISITINGLLKDFTIGEEKDFIQVKKQIFNISENQETYDEYVALRGKEFAEFVNSKEKKLKKFIRIDDVVKNIKPKLIAPVPGAQGIRYSIYADPAFHGYAGIDEHCYYTTVWYEIAKKRKIKVKELDIFDEFGGKIICIGEEEFCLATDEFSSWQTKVRETT
ncbi:hypothetical protein R9C00_28810 [Flammeovirgaceae bacterium SG7u.111]|nr:hypothetical protein [Flammeovirgaceae bacterium SG7u.132]WPO35701.1 hypothetical protein R9C00_28810 [Flammeovirgaceae bacterium SG7u.111]